MSVQLVPDSQQAPQVPSPALVSVVVTAGRHGRYQQQALDSIGSPGIPVETVVVEYSGDDDAATARARNIGLSRSLGEYVVFLDGEDRLAPGALELGGAQLEQHPEAAFVFGRCISIDADGTLMPGIVRPRIARDHYRELLRENYLAIAAMVMFRREALRRAGGFAEIAAAPSEYDLYLRISRHHPVHDHGQVVAFCRNDSDESPDPAGILLRETLDVLRRQRPFLEADDASLAAYAAGWAACQERYGSLLAREIGGHLTSHDWYEVLRGTATLLRYHPLGVWRHALRSTRLPHRYGRRAMPAS